ncbi:sulfatase-like hydrolase/transferase [Haloarcula litorea]|uniref:sulfatase-like hydrolase/transferase n=1 Tax=Haloarcula litorea TaxID=3032579 RepID=UPI0023E7B4FB|nr:sulfatase-like hydrolase/transferase [Halomicroarcula sp. GDY20]
MARPNVLLVVLDSVRARNCSLYGHANETTPFLTDFAEGATVYEQARAPGVHSIASHVSVFTGHEVHQHGLTEHGARLDPEATVWAELAADGYDTGLFTPNAVVTRSSNLGESFEHVTGPKRTGVPYPDALTLDDVDDADPATFVRTALGRDDRIRSLYNGLWMKFGSHAEHDPEAEAADRYLDDFLEWTDARDGPWAACVNLMDAHYPYRPAAEYDEWGNDRLHALHDDFPEGSGVADYINGDRPWWEVAALTALYDGCIRQADAAMERLVADLRERGLYEDTFLVVTSDHGECFGEPTHVRPDVRTVGHRYGVPEPLTHVPLVTKRPGQSDGDRVRAPTTLSAFPEAVDAVRDGAEEPAFRTDRPVLTSTFRQLSGSGLTTYLDDPDSYVGPWRAVYDAADGGDGVRKSVTHRDATATVRVRDAQTAYRTATDDDDRVAAAFDALDPVTIGEGEGDEGLAPDVEDHLEELGYIR